MHYGTAIMYRNHHGDCHRSHQYHLVGGFVAVLSSGGSSEEGSPSSRFTRCKEY